MDRQFWIEIINRLNSGLKLGEYYVADWLYLAMLVTAVLCLYRGHRSGAVNLWDVIRTTKDGHQYVDPRKLFEAGAFVVTTVAFSHMTIQGKLNEWFVITYLGAFVTARYLRDREQRLNKEIDLKRPPA